MKTTALFDLKTVVRNVVKPLGIENIIVTNLIGLQSDDISQGVDTGGAGDQGMMYGYATFIIDSLTITLRISIVISSLC